MLFRRAIAEKLKGVAPDPVAEPAKVEPAKILSLKVEPKKAAQESAKAADDRHPSSGSVIRLALSVDRPGFHLFVASAPGSGRRAAVKAAAVEISRASRGISDWVYAQAASFAHRLIPLELPAGTAPVFADGLARTLAETEVAMRDVAASKGFQNRRRLIEERLRHETDDRFQLLQERAEAQNLMLLTTPNGYAFAPVHEGRVVRAEIFQALPDALLAAVEEKIHGFEAELQSILTGSANADRELQAAQTELWRETVRPTVEHGFAPLAAIVDGSGDAEDYIRSLVEHIITEPRREQADLSRFRVHVMTEATPNASGITVTEAPDPSLTALFGSVSPSPTPTLTPGAVHQANGGILLLDAARLLKCDGAWQALAAALETGLARHPASAEGLPLTLKLVVIGSEDEYRQLYREAPSFAEHVRLIATLKPTPIESSNGKSPTSELLTAIGNADQFLRRDKAAAEAIDAHIAAADVALRTPRHLETVFAAADHLARAAGRKEITADDIIAAIAIDTSRTEILAAPDRKGLPA